MTELPNPERPREVRFHQIKSHLFRVIHADGLWVSMDPHHHLHITFYNERVPLPTEVVYPLTEANQIGDEILSERVTRKDWVREMEVDVVMTYERAVALNKWLEGYLAKITPQTGPREGQSSTG